MNVLPGIARSCLVASVWLLAARDARADVRFDVQSEAACLSQEDLVHLLPAAPEHEGNGSIDVTFAQTSTGWRVLIVAHRESGEVLGQRQLTTADSNCHTLDQRLALILDMVREAVVQDRQLEPEQPETLEAPQAAPAPTPTPRPEALEDNVDRLAPPAEVSSNNAAWTLGLFANARVGAQMLPGANWGGSIGFSAEPSWFAPVEFEAGVLLGDDASIAEGSASATWFGGAVSVCPRLLHAGEWALQLCPRFQMGTVRSSGQGFANNETRWGLTADGGGSVRVAWEFARGLTARVDALFTVPFHRFGLLYRTGSGEIVTVFREPAFAGAGVIGVQYTFP